MRCAFILRFRLKGLSSSHDVDEQGKNLHYFYSSGKNKKARFLGNHVSKRENQMTTSSMKGHTSLKISAFVLNTKLVLMSVIESISFPTQSLILLIKSCFS